MVGDVGRKQWRWEEEKEAGEEKRTEETSYQGQLDL